MIGGSVRIFVALALLLAAVAPAAAPSTEQLPPEQLVARAHEACGEGDYETAISCYNHLVKLAPHDPDVLYNLGTLHAQRGERGRAIWRYLQALQYAPRDPQLRHNLRAIDPDFERNIGVTPVPLLNDLLWRLTANEWALLATVATTLGFLLLALSFTVGAGGLRTVARRSGWLMLAVAVLAWGPACIRHYHEEMCWRGVVVAEGAVARIDPRPDAFENFTLPEGLVVRVLEHRGDGWLKIACAGDRIGFVPREAIESL